MTMRDAALDLARRGFRVHPLRGKVPLLKDWPAHATTELDKVELLWTQHPHANVGVATGGELLVLDVDTAKGKPGEASLKALVEKNGALPRTVVARTGSGGWHYYFRTNVEGLRNSAGKLGTGLDVRAEGGQVAAPPSKHESGRRYEWAPGFGPAEVDIAPAPAWLVDLLRPAPLPAPAPRRPAVDEPSAYARAQAYLAKLDPSVQGQNGSGALWKAAQALVRGFLLPEAEALALLASEFNPRCVPPWSEKELQHKVSDAASKSSLPHGWLLDAERPDDRPTRPLRAVPPEPPPPTDADAPPDVDEAEPVPSNVRPLRPTPGLATNGNAAIAPAAVLAPIPLTNSYASICQILRTPELRARVLGEGELEFNEQRLEPEIGRRRIQDHDISSIRERCEREFTHKKKGIKFGEGDVQKAVLQVAHEHPFHPVATYLRGLEWDRVPRIAHVAADILHVEATTLTNRLVRNFFIAAVARALRPGCKVDNVLTLVGKQRKKKSTFFRVLAGDLGFADTPVDIHDKDSKLLLRHVWILEWAELESVQRARSLEGVKAFITSQVDTIRPPYGRGIQDFPRTCIIAGTTNTGRFLGDPTGNRRWWPLLVGDEIEEDVLASQRDQLWAEAVVAFNAGEHWWLDDAAEDELAAAQEEHRKHDVWFEPIATWMEGRAEPPTMAEILLHAIGKPLFQQTDQDVSRASAVLRELGYEHRKRQINKHRAWRWVPAGTMS